MADYFPGKITIGGRIESVDTLFDLAVAIATEGPSAVDWHQESLNFDSAVDAVFKCHDELSALVLVDTQARYGEFEEIEEVLVEHGVQFDRKSDGRYEYDPQIRIFRPDLNIDMYYLTNEAEELAITLNCLRHDFQNMLVSDALALLDPPPIDYIQLGFTKEEFDKWCLTLSKGQDE